MIRGRVHRGPVALTDAPVVVSLTEFNARRFDDLPGIARDGIGLSRAWWAMPGAISVTLYLDPGRRRGGSLSVWASEEDLRRFVALPRHLAIMRRYRDRVSVRAATWRTERFSAAAVWEEREARLAAAAR
jgi:heme-degrading monooxygenase HmoA